MLADARSSTNSCRGSTTSTKTTRTMSPIRSFRLTLVVLAILGLSVLTVNAVPYGRRHQRTLRLCSKSLSDALGLVCRDLGGYNEPFSYSGEDHPRAPSGPSLVEECCNRPCSYEQLEQYCKSGSGEKRLSSQDTIEESLRIVNLPYSSTRELADERRAGAAIESNDKIIKSKDRNCAKLMERNRRRRKHGNRIQLGWKGMKISEAERRRLTRGPARGLDKHNDADDDYVGDAARRVCRRRRRRRGRQGQALRKATIASVPKFKVGTTLPELKDSMLLLFPSRTNLGFQRVFEDLANRGGIEAHEKFNSLYGDDHYDKKIDERSPSLTIDRP